MKDPETEFIQALGLSKSQLEALPDFMVRTYKEEDKVRVALRSKAEPPITFGDWVVATISRQDFLNMINNFNGILADFTKPKS